MTRRIIPFALFILTATFALGQTPKAVKTGEHDANQLNNLSMICPPGSNPDAGIATQALFPNAQSNDVLFLCLGDSMDIQHFGGDLSGDPQPASAPGFSYVFYNCPPTISGPSEALILTDPCHIAPPNITAVQAGVDINGNATFFNNGLIQDIFNAGDPMTVWFAPITLDDFASFGTEQDPNTGEQGPCIDVNVANAFTVTYLNAIEGLNINTTANGNCVASFTVTGGLPEFDGSNYTNISVTLNTDPSVVADINGANFTHNDLIEFTVPQAGVYDVLVEDDKSCAASFTIDMTGCDEVTFDASEEFTPPGSTVCVQIDVSDFTDVLSFQYTIDWDPTVLQLPTPISASVNNLGALNDIFFGPASPTSSLTVSWSDASFMGQSLADGTGIFEICFDVIGAAGSSSPITFSGSLTQVEVLNPMFQVLGFNGQAGSVTVAGAITLTFTSCSSPSSAANVGNFTTTASGGIPPYSYSWVNTANAAISGTGMIATNGGSDTAGDDIPFGDVPLPSGTYDVTLTDSNGGVQTASVEIFDAPELLVFIDGTPPTCATSTDGAFDITSLPLGGVAPHNIVWSNMQTGVTSITNLAQGPYSVTVTDAAGCMEVAQNGLQTPPIVVDTVSLQHVSCNGPGTDGAIIVTATGGTLAPGSDYDYAWNTGQVGPNISTLVPGTYCVTVTDDNLCEALFCLSVNAPMPPVIVEWDSTSVSCPMDMNGSLTVNAIAGNSPIDSYTWDPAQPGADETITDLGPGTYIVTITAVDGCTTIDTATLFAPTPLVFDSVQLIQPTCPDDLNGSITVFVSGGTAPYEYFLDNNAVSDFPVFPGLAGDSTYIITIIDSGVCGDTVVQSILLEDPPEIMVAFDNFEPVTCNGGVPCDGSVTAIASGGTALTGMYNFNWQSGETFSGTSISTAMQLCQGVFTLEVNDGLCSRTFNDSISAPPPLSVNIDNTFSTPVSCFGASDGGATVEGDGGIPGYTYQWIDPNISGPTIGGVPAGNYSVIITDANDCDFPFIIEVGEPDSLIALITNPVIDATCNGGSDGEMAVSWTGGNPGNATYAWTNNVSNTTVASGLTAGSYTVTVTDENGCNDIAMGVINEPPPIIFVIDTIVDPLCFGFQTFVSIDTAHGGAGGAYSFSVDNGPQNLVVGGSIPILAGQHTIMVFDNSMTCFNTEDIVVNQPPPVIVDLGEDIEIELGDSVELDPIIGSALPIDTIIWSPLTALTCLDPMCSEVSVMPLETSAYQVMVTDINGCVGEDNILVEVDKNRNVFIPNIFTPDGDGFNDIFTVFTGVGVERVNFMRVYDRWGEQVFESPSFIPSDFGNMGWDGSFKGKIMNPAVYIYLIEVEFSDGIVLLYRGDVTLLH